MAFEGYFANPADSEFAILLNGEPVDAEPDSRIWGPIALEPDKDYTLVVRLTGAPEFRSTFSTGAVRPVATELPPPVIAGVEASEFNANGLPIAGYGLEDLTAECQHVFLTADCYDTGPRDLLDVSLAPDSSRPWPDEGLVFHTRDAVERLPPFRGLETMFPGALCRPLSTHPLGFATEQPCVQVRYRVPDGRYSEWSEPACAEDWSGRPVDTDVDAGGVFEEDDAGVDAGRDEEPDSSGERDAADPDLGLDDDADVDDAELAEIDSAGDSGVDTGSPSEPDSAGCAVSPGSPGTSWPGPLAILAALLICRRREGRGCAPYPTRIHFLVRYPVRAGAHPSPRLTFGR
jgi:MYXO-CTERM domain-containing protein